MKGTGAGHRLDHNCNDVKCLWAISLRDLIICFVCFEKFYRGAMIIQTVCFAQRCSTYNMAHLFEGNKWNTLGGASVICVSIFMLVYLILGQTIFYRFFAYKP